MGRKIALIATILSVLLTFQNCTSSTEGTTSADTLLSENMDFSLDTTIDQIAYMSCPRVATTAKAPIDASMYFTFRAGAYRFGGVKLADTFYTTYQGKTQELLADLLVNSPANSSTLLQLAIRQVGSLNSVVTGPGAATQNMDFANMFTAFGPNALFTSLISTGLVGSQITGTRTRDLPDGTGLGAHVEGTLNFGTTEALQDAVRTQYLGSGAGILTVTYLEPTTTGSGSTAGGSSGTTGTAAQTDVRNQGTVFPTKYSNNAALAYGTGYQLQFSQPTGSPKGLQQYNTSGVLTGTELLPYPSNWMTGVVEKNLLTGVSGSSSQWVCPDTLRFRVIRPGDEADPAAYCPRVPDLDVTTNMQFAIARNALRVEDWYINMDQHCILPKRSAATSTYSCYGDMTKIDYVQYDVTNSAGCDPNSDETSNAANSKSCMAWATICYRVSP